MTPAPLSVVIKVVADATSYHPVRNRETIVKMVNGVMKMLYRTPAHRLNYFKVDDCAVTDSFQDQCRGCSPVNFLGVVMPPGVSGVREITAEGVSYDITEKRTVIHCARPGRGCAPTAERLTPRLLEKDIPSCNDNRVVTFVSDADCDCNLVVGTRYIDLNDREQREDLVLGTSTSATSLSVRKFLEITFPERKGWITVRTAQGAFLGRYHPGTFIPEHEWFRLQAGCRGMEVNYRGIREPLNVVFDSDMVPFSDDTLWRVALKIYQNIDSMEMSPAQTNALARMYAMVSAVTSDDISAKRSNFNTTLMPDTGKAMMATGALFSRRS